MQKIRKILRTVSEISKDGLRTDHGQGRLLRTPSGKPGVQNSTFELQKCKKVSSVLLPLCRHVYGHILLSDLYIYANIIVHI